eukprot:1434864-Rhodomonas_salina.2
MRCLCVSISRVEVRVLECFGSQRVAGAMAGPGGRVSPYQLLEHLQRGVEGNLHGLLSPTTRPLVSHAALSCGANREQSIENRGERREENKERIACAQHALPRRHCRAICWCVLDLRACGGETRD